MQVKWIILMMLLWPTTIMFAQSKGNMVKGLVVEPDGLPVMYATACIMNDGKVVAGALTDTLGVFMIKGRFSGDYALRWC